MIDFTCPNCKEKHHAPLEHEGFAIRCARCGTTLRIVRKPAQRPISPPTPNRNACGMIAVLIVLGFVVAAVDHKDSGARQSPRVAPPARSSYSRYRPEASEPVEPSSTTPAESYTHRSTPVVHRTMPDSDQMAILDYGDYIEQGLGFGIPPTRVPKGGPGDANWKAKKLEERRMICDQNEAYADSLTAQARGTESSSLASGMRGTALGVYQYCMQENLWQAYLLVAR